MSESLTTQEERNKFFTHLANNEIPEALGCLANGRQKFNTELIEKALKKNQDRSRPSSQWTISQSTWAKFFQELLKRHGEPEDIIDKGYILLRAIAFDHIGAVEVLGKTFSQEEISRNPPGWAETPLVNAIKFRSSPPMFEYLVQTRNVDVNRADAQGHTPLSMAVNMERLDYLRRLLDDHNADPNLLLDIDDKKRSVKL